MIVFSTNCVEENNKRGACVEYSISNQKMKADRFSPLKVQENFDELAESAVFINLCRYLGTGRNR